jgi:Helix-turn-helix domain of resolvase
MIRLYEAGQSAATVAEQLQVSPSCVLKILKADAVAVRLRGNPGDFKQ